MNIYPNRLAMIAAMPPGGVGAEIGVLRGDFSREILATQVGLLHLVDCWRKQGGDYALDPANTSDHDHEVNYHRVVADLGGNSRVRLHRGMSLEIAKKFPDWSLDWVYIDADHTYDAVLADLITWSTRVKPGGALMGHDFCVFGETFRMKFRAYDAVQDFCRSTEWYLAAVTDEQWASFKLKRRGE